MAKGWRPGGERGKLHREMGIPEGRKIPKDRLRAAAHSDNPEERRDAIRAETMEKWHHGPSRRKSLYTHARSQAHQKD